MREIKFRVWDKENEIICDVYRLEWLEGKLFADCFPHLRDMRRVLDTANNPLMQYIGLKDSEGAEIYEGDIVLVGAHLPTQHYRIVFEQGDFQTGFKKKSGDSLTDLGKEFSVKFEIIGNIHENPELLEKSSTSP